MYFFGPERRAGVDDFRDAVHDSDGLRIVNGARRAAVAAAAQPRRRRDLGLLRRQPAGLRPHPARPRLRALRGRRGALRAAPERLGRAGRALGRGRGHAGGAADRRRVHRQHRRLLAPGRAARRRLASTASATASPGAWPRTRSCRSPASIATRSGLSILDARERVFVVDFDLGMINFATVDAQARGQRRRDQGPQHRAAPRRQHRPRRLPLHRRRAPRRRVPPLARERGRPGLRGLALPLEQVTAGARARRTRSRL